MNQTTSKTILESHATLRERGSLDQHAMTLADAMPQIVWTANPDGGLDYYNQHWIEYTGMSIEQTRGWGWEAVLHPDDLQNCVDAWTNAYTTGLPYQIEYRFKRASDGTYRWHLGRALPVRDSEGNITKWFGTCTDIHEQKSAFVAVEERVRQRTAELAAANSSLLEEIEERKLLAASHERDSVRLNGIIATQCQLAAAELDLEAFMKLVVYRMDTLTKASSSIVELVEGDEMVYRAASGVAAGHIGLRLNRATSISGLCVETGVVLRCDDTENDPRVDRAACERIGIRSLIVAPLLHDGKAIGVLKSMAVAPYAFGARDMQTLQLMAGLVGSAIAHQIAFNAKQELLDELSTTIEAMRAIERRTEVIVESSHDAFVGIDAVGMITDWNGAAERTFGWTNREVIGRNIADIIIPAAYQAAHQRGMDHFLKTGEESVINRRIEVSAVSRAGIEFPVELTISEFQVNGGRFFGAFLHDISERRRNAEALEEKQKLLDTVLETIDVGVIACSSDGELTLFNRAAREFHGLDVHSTGPDEWAQEYDLFGADGITPLAKADIPLFRALQGEIVQNVEMAIRPRARKHRFLLASGKPLIGAQGKKLGAVIAMQDISERKEAQQNLAESEQRLRAIADNLPMMIGQIDRNEIHLFLNKRAERYYGKASGSFLGRSLRDTLGDSEYQRVKPYIDAALDGRKVSFESEAMVNGTAYHYHAAYIPDLDLHGNVKGLYAMAFDITDRKKSELRQAESEERLRTITDSLPVLISYIDQHERYQFCNATYQKWFGTKSVDMHGKSVREVVGEKLYEPRKDFLRRALAGEHVRHEAPVMINGESKVVESIYIPHLRNGRVEGIYTLSTDITALKEVEKQLSLLARSDPLTNLPNRRSFDEKLSEAAMRSKRSGQLLALMYLDIDRFKTINDTLGHAAGDEILKEFAKRIQAAVRSTDTVARLAGDEFTIILEGIKVRQEAALVAEKILAAVQKPFILSDDALSVTTSIGIAFLTVEYNDLPDLIRRSDDALYKAKSSGRNRFWVDGDGDAG